ncbi:MAG: hypothetical protein GY697_00475 [Desulfobacterales bacterium]|nr:hypothetical protein [Desulfobacterales bacterium]
MTGIRRNAHRWNFFIYFIVLCFLSSVVDVKPVFAKTVSAKLVYDLLDDSIDYEWIKGEDDIVYRASFKIEKNTKDYWLVAVKEAKKDVLSKVKAKLQKKMAKYDRMYQKEKKALANSGFSEKKLTKEINKLMKVYVGQVKTDLKRIKGQHDDEMVEKLQEELMDFLKVKNRKQYERAKKRGGLALKLTAIALGATALGIGLAAAIVATIFTAGTAAIVIGAVAATAAAVAGTVSAVVATYRTVAAHMRSTMVSLEETEKAFKDFEEVAEKAETNKKLKRALAKKKPLTLPVARVWKKNILKEAGVMKKSLNNFSKNITRTAKAYTKVDTQIDKIKAKLKKVKKSGDKKEEKQRLKLNEMLEDLDKTSDEELDELRAMVKLYGEISSSLRDINKKLKGPKLRDTIRDAVQNIDAKLAVFQEYGQPLLNGMAKTYGSLQKLDKEITDAQSD